MSRLFSTPFRRDTESVARSGDAARILRRFPRWAIADRHPDVPAVRALAVQDVIHVIFFVPLLLVLSFPEALVSSLTAPLRPGPANQGPGHVALKQHGPASLVVQRFVAPDHVLQL